MLKKIKKGFTLAELLVVVAIIAVLVGISIPIFTSQLEKAREATDLANLRAAYAEVVTAALTNDTSGANGVSHSDGQWFKDVEITQKINGWQSVDRRTTYIGNAPLYNGHDDVSVGQIAQVYCTSDGETKVWFQCPDDGDGRGCSYD